MIWLEFSAVSLAVIVFGYLLSEKADRLAEAKNLGKGLVGFILLGFSTSVPELISTLSSTVLLDNPQLGAGNIIGSNNANMFILFSSLLFASSLRNKKGLADDESLVSSSFCLIVTAVFMSAVLGSGMPVFAGKPVYTHVLLAVFFISIYELHKSSTAGREEKEIKRLYPLFYIQLALLLVVLVAASYYLAAVVDRISRETGFGATASGAIFLAWSTSLPELAVTVSSVIIGSSEMGIGNILGSNIFNMSVLALSELFSASRQSVFYRDENLLSLGLMQFFMLSVLLVLLSQKKTVRIWRVSVLPAVSLAGYVLGMVMIL